jgi:hypothetical protein
MNNSKVWGEICLKVLAPALVTLGGILLAMKNDNNGGSQE